MLAFHTGQGSSINSPVKIYDVLNDKTQILKENNNKSGIYRWINIDNGKSYVGSSVNLKERFVSYYNINHLKENYDMLICPKESFN